MSNAVKTTDFENLILKHRGKVRDMYEIPGHDDKLLMVASDRLSAYDVIMEDPIPGKGAILTELSLFWFDLLGDIVENHLISADVADFPEVCQPYADDLRGRSMLVKKTKPLPIECIVRGYISGSFWSAYKKDTIVCGFQLPENMQESDKFPEILFTPSTKAEMGDHDENISLEKMKEMLAEQLNCEASTITPETSFKDDLGADSLDLFELVMALEDEYNVEIPAEELTDLNTVGDVIDYLKNKGVEA